MNILKHILFSLVVVAGLSCAALAQKGGDDKKPPKPPPPVIKPGDKQPPKNDKPKKPGMAENMIVREEYIG